MANREKQHKPLSKIVVIQSNTGKRVENTCFFFQHMTEPHKHLCDHARNASNRCGYDVHDWLECPLVVYDETEVRGNLRRPK